jgi:hypothetical protein
VVVVKVEEVEVVGGRLARRKGKGNESREDGRLSECKQRVGVTTDGCLATDAATTPIRLTFVRVRR